MRAPPSVSCQHIDGSRDVSVSFEFELVGEPALRGDISLSVKGFPAARRKFSYHPSSERQGVSVNLPRSACGKQTVELVFSTVFFDVPLEPWTVVIPGLTSSCCLAYGYFLYGNVNVMLWA